MLSLNLEGALENNRPGFILFTCHLQRFGFKLLSAWHFNKLSILRCYWFSFLQHNSHFRYISWKLIYFYYFQELTISYLIYKWGKRLTSHVIFQWNIEIFFRSCLSLFFVLVTRKPILISKTMWRKIQKRYLENTKRQLKTW